jgi:hypothetical protein
MFAKLGLFFAALVLAMGAALAQETITIGGETITIPLPKGFSRIDGKNAELDRSFPNVPMNRLLLMSAADDVAAELLAGRGADMQRSFNIQITRNDENKTVTLKDFQNARGDLEKVLGTGPDGLTKMFSKEQSGLKSMVEAAKLKLGQPQPLGIFESTDRSLDFGVLIGVQTPTGKTITTATAGSLVLVRGKALLLYSNSLYRSNDDITWVKNSLKSWREAILAANPGGTPESSFSFGSVGKNAIIGGIVGGIGALIVGLMRKKKQLLPPPPPPV